MAKKPVKKQEVKEVPEKQTIQVNTGNVDPIKIQFLQAINNQLGIIIQLLQDIKDK